MVKFIIWVIVCWIIFKIANGVSTLILFKNVKGCFGTNRFNNKIQMLGSKKLSKKQFIGSLTK